MKRLATILLAAITALGITLIDSCKKKDATPTTPISFNIPSGWPAPPTDIFASNPPTEESFQLGRKLFYDGKLSKDGNYPCASCHQQISAFNTYDHDFSHGYNNTHGTRNAPGLFNIAWMRELSWDGSSNSIETQSLRHITATNEMAESIDAVLKKLRTDPTYPAMFKRAYGDPMITSQRMLKSLAVFVGMLVSSDSKYDKVKKGEAAFTNTEQSGYAIFRAKCESCHKEPLFTDHSFRNNGLSVEPLFNDYGRMKVTGLKSDSLKFKVPSLRNVAITQPYMHDARFYDLGQVLNHYSTGIKSSPTLDPLLVNKIPLTNSEKIDLISFMRTLTDSSFIKNPSFSQP